MKICTMCKKSKKIEEFSKNKNKPDGMQNHCKECHKEYRRKHYLENKPKYVEKSAEWRNTFRKWWHDYKSKLSCSKCGEQHPAIIDFHHSNPAEKDSEVAKLISSGNRKKIEEEIKKCIVLCANCHRIEHYDERNAIS